MKPTLVYLNGSVGILSSLGGQGGAGNGFEYLTRTSRSSLLSKKSKFEEPFLH